MAGLFDSPIPVADPIAVGLVRRYRLELGPGKLRVASTATGSEVDGVGSVRGEVVGWSRKSRLRMVEVMSSLDWGPVVEPTRTGWYPAMVTLTLPGDWLPVAGTPSLFTAAVERFWSRWERAWGPVSCVWKKEFQRRGAPHLHFYAAVGLQRSFAEWLSLAWTCAVYKLRVTRRKGEAWAELVDRVRGRYGRGVADHLMAGTGIDWTEGTRATDPKRLAVYFLKRATGHNVGVDKEYQHLVPEQWTASGEGPGRFWGYKGLNRCDVQVGLDEGQFFQLRRLARRWAKANGRAVRSLAGGHGSGGMILVNDAPTWAAQASRWDVLQRPADGDSDGHEAGGPRPRGDSGAAAVRGHRLGASRGCSARL